MTCGMVEKGESWSHNGTGGWGRDIKLFIDGNANFT